MLDILQAVGFREVVDQRSFQAALESLAKGARPSPDGTLIANAFSGCSLRLRLDAHGGIEGIDLELDSAEQAICVHRLDEAADGLFAHGFTCFDCLPVAPITVVATRPPAEFQPRRCYFTRLSGIVTRVDPSNAHPGDMAFGQPNANGFLPMFGVLTASRLVENNITGERVNLAELALPGLALAAILPQDDFEPGAMVCAEGRIHAVFSDPVP